MHVLVVYHYDGLAPMRLAIQRHLQVLRGATRNCRILYFNALEGCPSWLRVLRFDAVVFHTTFLGVRWQDKFPAWKKKFSWVQTLSCPKVALPQDEYDHAHVLDEWLAELGVTSIFSIYDEPLWPILYPVMATKAKIYKCLTAYIDDRDIARLQARCVPLEQRPYDIVYRGTQLPLWFGSHGYMKTDVARRVLEHPSTHSLTCDISTKPEKTILGPSWLEFLGSGKAVIGCEGGSSVMDRRGEIRAMIRQAQQETPHLTLNDLDGRLPSGWNSYRFFSLSPRHLEAVMTKTCQVLVEGDYDGVFRPGDHYLSIKQDYSNLGEVLERIRDTDGLRMIADRAYREIGLNEKFRYKKFADDILKSCLPDNGERFGMRIGRNEGASITLWNAGVVAAKVWEVRGRGLFVLNRVLRKIGRWLGFRK